MKPTILVVDDERAITIAIQRLLSTAGYAVDTALSGEEAIEQLGKSLYHLVITDLSMKKASGMDVLRWVKQLGGLPALETRNRQKAGLLYGALEAMAGFYTAPVERESRSTMNVVFHLPRPELDDAFVQEARARHMVGLKGHRTAGGIRASLYNAVSVEDVQALVDFMRDFARRHG